MALVMVRTTRLSEGRAPTSAVSSGAISDGACPHRMRDNHTQGEITRTSARSMSVCQAVTEIGAGLMWQADKATVTGSAYAAGRRLSESRMRENAYLPSDHVRFEVSEDGSRDVVGVLRHSQEETESRLGCPTYTLGAIP
jgi:hypothetical protein